MPWYAIAYVMSMGIVRYRLTSKARKEGLKNVDFSGPTATIALKF